MEKNLSYYRSAIIYNEALATRASQLAREVEHEEIQRWCRSVAKQHTFHAGRHKKALAKMEEREAEAEQTTSLLTEDEVRRLAAKTEEHQTGLGTAIVIDAGEGSMHVVDREDEPQHSHAAELPCGPGCPVFEKEEGR